MTEREQLVAFENDLNNLINRYEHEFQLSAAGAVGVLMMKVHGIMAEASKDEEE